MRVYKSNFQSFTRYLDKLNRNELRIEDILEDDDLVADIKTNPNTQFACFFSGEIVRRLIDYATKMPESEDLKTGHKYPFNACEILCSENSFVLDRLLEVMKIELESEDDDDQAKDSRKSSCFSEEKEIKEEKSEKEKQEEPKEEEKEEGSVSPIQQVTEIHPDVPEMAIVISENPPVTPEIDEQPEKQTQEVEKPTQGAEKQEETLEGETVNKLEANPLPQPLAETEPQSKDDSNNQKKPEHSKKKHGNIEDAFPEYEDNELFNISQEKNEPTKKEDESNYKLLYETLDYFYTFLLLPERELNHVLAGYFYKIFNHLMNVRGVAILKYLFIFKKEILKCLVKHTNRKAIGECVHRILIFTSEELKCGNEIKTEIVESLFQEIQQSKDPDQIEIIADVLMECLGNKNFFTMFISNVKLFKQLNDLIRENLRSNENFKYLIRLLVKINENIIKDMGTQVTPMFTNDQPGDIFNIINLDNPISLEEEQVNPAQAQAMENAIKPHLEEFIEILRESCPHILDDLILSDMNQSICEFPSTYDRPQKIFGMKRLIEFEYLRTLIEIIINGIAAKIYVERLNDLISLMIEKGLFIFSISAFYQFEFNNFYQKLFEQLIMLSVTEAAPEMLVHHIFGSRDGDCNFLKSIIDQIEKNLRFNFSSGKQMYSGFFASLIEVSYHIIQSTNIFLKEILDAEEGFKSFYSYFLEPVKTRFSQKLLLQTPSSGKTLSISNLESLQEPEAESRSKELDNALSLKSLSDIINENLAYHEAQKLSPQKWGATNDEEFNIIEEDILKKEEAHLDSPADFNRGGKSIEDFSSDMQQVFEKRSSEAAYTEIFEPKPANNHQVPLSNEEEKVREKSQDEFYDNNFWKGHLLQDEERKLMEMMKELNL